MNQWQGQGESGERGSGRHFNFANGGAARPRRAEGQIIGRYIFSANTKMQRHGREKEPEEQERIGKTRKEFAWLDVFGICGFWDVCRNTIPFKMITYRLFFSEGLFTE